MKTKNYLIGIIAGLISFFTYLRTLCPTVHWGDSGEFITAAYTLGITHPTGYPTYTMLGHLFTYLPFGSVAFRVNLMSAFFASLAVMLLFFLCLKLTRNRWISLVSSLILAFSYTFWSQAVIAEVHTLSALLVILNLLLLFHWRQGKKENGKRANKWLYLFCLSYGLTLTNHMTTVILFPAFLYFILVNSQPRILSIRFNTEVLRPKVILFCLTFFLLGLMPQSYLLVRSAMHPLWNWGEISNLTDWVNHIRGAEYTGTGFVTTKNFSYNLNNFLASFSRTLSLAYFVPPLASIIWLVRRTYRKNMILPCFLGLTIIPLATFALNYDTDSGAFFMPIIIVLVLLTGILLKLILGVSRKTATQKNSHPASRHKTVVVFAALLAVTIIFSLFITNYGDNDLSKDYSAYHYGKNILESAPPNSIIIGKGTHDLFIFLYLQEAEKKYTDRIAVDTFGITKPWTVNFFKRHIDLSTSNISLKKIYPSRSEALQTTEEMINRLIEDHLPSRDIYTTFRNISTKYYVLLYGHINKISVENIKLDFPNIKYPYPSRIENEDGRKFVANVLIFYGLNTMSNNKYLASIDYFKQAVQINDASFEGWNNLAIAYYETGQADKAASAWEKALQLRDDKDIRRNIRILQETMGRGKVVGVSEGRKVVEGSEEGKVVEKRERGEVVK